MPLRIPVTFLPLGTEMVVHDYDEVGFASGRYKLFASLTIVATYDDGTGVLQGNNGRFELLLEKDGQPFEVFDVAPQKILNEASLLLRVLQPEAIDYEVQHSYSFQVISTKNPLDNVFYPFLQCNKHFQRMLT